MPGQYVWIFGQPATDSYVHVPNSNITVTNCTDGVQWLWIVLRDCVYDGQGVASDIFGLVSIAIWLLVSVPQMIKNFRNIRGVEGISFFLILQWTLGDTTNLIGSILTHQLPLQTYLAVYFVFSDLILFSQFIYYQIWKRKRKNHLNGTVHVNGPSKIVLCFAGAFLAANMILDNFLTPVIARTAYPATWSKFKGRQLLSTNLGRARYFTGITEETGYAIGVVSSLLYIGSRLSQIYKNHKRRSTDGLSVVTFWLAVFGNIAYGLSILVRSLGSVFLIQHLPWLVGSLGVVLLDVTLLVQFKYFGAENFDTLSNAPLTTDDELDVENQKNYPDHDDASIN